MENTIDKIITSSISLIIILLIYIIVNKSIKRFLKKYVKENKRKKTLILLLKNIIKYFMAIIAVIIVLSVFGFDTKTMITSIGAAGVIIGLALQDLFKDIISGFFIIFEEQFGVGDTIKIGDFKGEVISIGLRSTRVKSFTGEIKIFSNRNIQEVINYSLSKSLAIVNIVVSADENVEKVEKVLDKLCKRLTKELVNITGDVTLLGITNLGLSGTQFRINVETEALKHYEVERQIMKEVKIELEKNKIELPTNQFVSNEQPK